MTLITMVKMFIAETPGKKILIELAGKKYFEIFHFLSNYLKKNLKKAILFRAKNIFFHC
jgi:hypothetical protein